MAGYDRMIVVGIAIMAIMSMTPWRDTLNERVI